MLKRTPLKRTSSLKKTGKLKAKKRTPEQVAADKEQRQKDNEFYEQIWANRVHYCQVCDTYLGSTLNRCYMDHILEKGLARYAHLRYEPDNIALVCMNCHGSKTNGFTSVRYVEMIEKARKLFGIM